MNKSIIIGIILGTITLGLVVACGSNVDDPTVTAVNCTQELQFTRTQLEACKASLDACGLSDPDGGGTPVPSPSPSEEPEQEVVTFLVENTKCYNVEETSCGLTFNQCENDTTYYCMTNFKYKTKVEKQKNND